MSDLISSDIERCINNAQLIYYFLVEKVVRFSGVHDLRNISNRVISILFEMSRLPDSNRSSIFSTVSACFV